MKKTVICVLIITLIIVALSSFASAGTYYFSRSLPADGSITTVGYCLKTTEVNGSYIFPSYETGILKAVKCHTKAEFGGGQIIYTNPIISAPKGSSTWLGAYIGLDLYSGQKVWLEMWTNTIGVADTTAGTWDFK